MKINKKILFFLFIPILVINFSIFFGKNDLFFYKKNENSANQIVDLTNPYIIKDGFEINGWDINTSSVIFTLTIVGEWSAVESMDVFLTTDEGNEEFIATRLEENTHVIDSNINEIEYSYQITSLDLSENYTFYSLNNTGLAIENNDDIIDEEILISEDLNASNNISFNFETNNNAYIENQSFKIEKVSYNLIDFSFNASKNWAIQDNLSLNIIQLTNEGSIDGIFETSANLKKLEDLNNDFIKLTYEINSEDDTFQQDINDSYIINEFLNTYLTTENSSNPINNDIYTSSIGVELSETSFHLESPYINDFKILKTSENSVEFQINVTNNYLQSFEFDQILNVTLISNSNQETFQTEANYVSTNSSIEDGLFSYEITGLDSSVGYTIISIDNSWLAVGDFYEPIDEQIMINEDLQADGNFITKNKSNTNLPNWAMILILIFICLIVFVGILLLLNFLNRDKKIKIKKENTDISKNKK